MTLVTFPLFESKNVKRLYPEGKVLGLKAICKPKTGWTDVHYYYNTKHAMVKYLKLCKREKIKMVQVKIETQFRVVNADYTVDELLKGQ